MLRISNSDVDRTVVDARSIISVGKNIEIDVTGLVRTQKNIPKDPLPITMKPSFTTYSGRDGPAAYSITDTPQAVEAVRSISARMASSSKYQKKGMGKLHLVSMKESYDITLLTRFYEELMIPNFPLEEERDDLDHWIWCFDPSVREKYRTDDDRDDCMDVLMLIMVSPTDQGKLTEDCKREEDDDDDDNDDDAAVPYDAHTVTILGGIAFDYFQYAQVGLLSYMVMSEHFRRLGILKALHPVACHAMQVMHQAISSSATKGTNRSRTIKAIFAETNTLDAGDAPRETIQKRHEILYRLGYRLLKFPYVQPPLGEGEETFDDIMLLVHVGDGESRNGGDPATVMDTKILHDYVVDFFQSVTGYDNRQFERHWYFQLTDWFTRRYPTTEIASGLPWEDVTPDMQREMELDHQPPACLEQRPSATTSCTVASRHRNEPVSERHVVVVGAGIAGLVATVTLAEEYILLHQQSQKSQKPHLSPLRITLVEAHPFVGGRIRTVITDPDATNDYKSPLLFSNEYLHGNQDVSAFAPWPVPIGAEFVHGVDSMVTELIEQNDDWTVQETFDLCSTPDDYPSDNGFVRRRSTLSLTEEQRKNPHVQIFLGGTCYPVQHGFFETQPDAGIDSCPAGARMKRLIRRAQALWQSVQSIRDQVYETDDGEESQIINDMSLEQFIQEQLANDPLCSSDDIEVVAQILESMFSNTWSSSNKYLGIHESSREEWNWDYTQSNFRSQHCFNELIAYYLEKIETMNKEDSSLLCITIETNRPITEIGSFPEQEFNNRRPIRVSAQSGNDIDCDKCIVAIPLAALKAQKISFQADYQVPADMQRAIDSIEMFSGMKAHMLLKVGIDITAQCKLMKSTEIFFCPGTLFSQVWLRRNDDTVFLTGFCLANCRDNLVSLAAEHGMQKDEFARRSMLEQLQSMFETSESECQVFVDAANPTCSAFALHDWADDEYILGAYSSPSVGAGWNFSTEGTKGELGSDNLTTCRDILNTPIKDAIWLAGEHVYSKTSATVQSAMESGKRAAQEVLTSLVKTNQEI